ncbi:bactericidal permeability-increasing protein-like, partial [Protobothrops mucrosquamatus]|uniref:bactericidal permeability-increasing protein-like n=1 Tax=Protobothrops mucrosquamatus TaxID=103944 RepID=UPI0007756777
WLYNLFESKVESAFKTAMESKICEIVRTSVNSKLESHLQSLPVTTSIDHTSSIDYSLVGPPVATSDCVDLDLKGEFFSNAQRTPAPFPPPPLSFPVDPDRMIQFGISTYFFNTAGQVYYQSESLTTWIVDDMVPKEIKIRLNTLSFEPFIPQIKQLYPSMPMKLRVSPSSAPSLSISPESISLTPSVDIQAFVILPNSSLAPLFLIGVTTSVSAKVDVNSTRIFGDLKMGRMRFSLKHSDVGIFSVQLLETLINFLTGSILIPQMNGKDVVKTKDLSHHLISEFREGQTKTLRDLEAKPYDEMIEELDLQLETWDLKCEENNQDHKTSEMGSHRLVVRRGRPFRITLHFAGRAYQEGVDRLSFIAET